MNSGRFIFTQLCDFLPRRQFERYVAKYEGNKYVKSFTCWNHLLVMLFGQLADRESLRDLISSLAPYQNHFHHLGFGKSVTRSNLSKANEIREVRIFEDMANLMIIKVQKLRGNIKDPFLDVDGRVYAFDSSTISLCLSTYWWGKLHHDKGGVKLHTLYDVQSNIPTLNIITNASLHDSQVMDAIPYNKGDYYVFDRGYMDTKQLYLISKMHGFFVVRERTHIDK
ncbi:MAG: IS4 family transposase [Prevotellaceae bacterium]|nr:IS4 family transposase [Prevotellaceae bacterium]